MIGDILKSVIGPILKPLIDRIPDANERARAQEKYESQLLSAITGVVQGQLAINMKEAEHGSVFVAGWRPAVGWICAAGLAWNYIFQPLLLYAAWIIPEGAELANAPELDIADLLVILGGMLGLGTLRTYEKSVGVARTGTLGGSPVT